MNPFFLHKRERPDTGRLLLTLQGNLLAGALLGAIVLNISCGGGSHGDNNPTPPPPPPPTVGSVIGTVKNAVSGQPIPGAMVTDGTTTTTTGADGTYALSATPADRKQITVKASNFGDTQQIATVAAGKSIKVDIGLLPATVTQISDLASDTTIVVPNTPAQVTLPAGGLVTSGGGAPSFPVKASLTPIDPSNNPQLMPGDYTTSAGEQLESFGALDVTFKDQTGAPLNLAPGKLATIQIPLASFHWGGVPPTTVPAYYFDTTTGRWVREGTLTLAGTGIDQYYVGTVGHFTTWNADNVAVTTCITGKVVRTDGSGVSGAVVTATGVSYIGVSTITSNTDGTFQLPVMANQTFTVAASLGYLSTGTPVLTVTNPSCVLNGTFIDASFWTAGTNWTITPGSPGSAAHASGNTATLSENLIGLVANANYTVTYTISGLTAGNLTATLGGTGGTSGAVRSTNGTFTDTIKCGTSTPGSLVFTPSSAFVGSISNISVVPVTPATCQAIGNLVIDGKLYITGTIRDFSPSAPYQFPYALTTNGTFASDTGWNKGTGWTISGGVATCGVHAAVSDLSQNQLVTSGQSYPVTYTITRTAGTITPILGGTNGTVRNSNGTWTETIACGAGTDPKLIFRADAAFRGTITNIAVGDGHPPAVTISATTPFPLYNRTGGDAYLAQFDGPWWNPDFESKIVTATGMVNVDLGANQKPVFTGLSWASCAVNSAASFNSWWTDFPSPHGPNDATPYQGTYTIGLAEVLPATTPPTYSYDNQIQFPNDGKFQGNYIYNNGTGTGRGNAALATEDSKPHNFHYTYELHISFTYKTGQVFTFIGDDDVWVFINKKLVIDLGGIHGALTGSVTLNAATRDKANNLLNLVDGQVYQFDFFYCERHTTQSHMKITTSIPLNDTLIPN